MQPNQPLLTIAIPTYNRAKYLDMLLSGLAPQLLTEKDVDLIISDNASIDTTKSVAQEYSKKIKCLLYIKNPTNLGADGNILQCFEKSRGKYLWVLGDDDVVALDAIAKIMSYLRSGEYDLIHINPMFFDGACLFEQQKKVSPPSPIKDVRVFVRRVNIMLTFISSTIVNKNHILECTNLDFTSLVGTSLVQLGWTYTALDTYRSGLYIEEQLVGGRSNNTGGYKLFETFGPNLKEMTELYLKDKALRRPIIHATLMAFWPQMVVSYRMSSSSFDPEAEPQKILRSVFGDNFRYWLFVFPVFYGPLIVSKFHVLMTRILCKLDKWSGYLLSR